MALLSARVTLNMLQLHSSSYDKVLETENAEFLAVVCGDLKSCTRNSFVLLTCEHTNKNTHTRFSQALRSRDLPTQRTLLRLLHKAARHDTDFLSLLRRCEVRWAPRGQCFSRVLKSRFKVSPTFLFHFPSSLPKQSVRTAVHALTQASGGKRPSDDQKEVADLAKTLQQASNA